jgi:hypothetical protein
VIQIPDEASVTFFVLALAIAGAVILRRAVIDALGPRRER